MGLARTILDPHHVIEGLTLSPAEVRAKTKAIYDAVVGSSATIREPDFDRISELDLKLMFKEYDRRFFDGLLRKLLDETQAAPMGFRLSVRMTSSGGRTARNTRRVRSGKTTREQPVYEIAISADVLFQTFNGNHRTVTANGLVCNNRLEALQRIFEHELIHLLEFLVWDESRCSRQRFQSLARHVFGHTDHTHRLITRKEQARLKHGIQVGHRVRFQDNEGTQHIGVVNRITKRATVLVESQNGEAYTDGKRYIKFYIPIPMLERMVNSVSNHR